MLSDYFEGHSKGFRWSEGEKEQKQTEKKKKREGKYIFIYNQNWEGLTILKTHII